jgi:hypothetical protein
MGETRRIVMEYIGHIIALIPGLAALYLALGQYRKTRAEESKELTDIAMSLVRPLEAKIDRLERELAIERTLRQGDAIEAAMQGRVLAAAIQYINELTGIMRDNGLKVPEKPSEIEAWLRKQTNTGKTGKGD